MTTALDRPEFRALFMDQRERIFRLLYRLTGDAAEAEDLLQDAFLAVWKKRHQFEGRGAPEGYLRTTAVRLFLNAREVKTRRTPLRPVAELEDTAHAAAHPSDELERRESVDFLTARVKEALASLPDEARDAFVLFRFEGFSCREIAEATGAPLKTVETRLRRATLVLAEKLRPYRNLLSA